MADSPLTSGHRVLTRSDSMRFISSRGGLGFAYGFTCASVLCMVLFVLNPSSYYAPPRFRDNNAIHSSRTYHFSQAFSHIFTTNSSFSPPSHHTHTTNSNPHVDSSKQVNTGAVYDHRHKSSHNSSSQMSRKEGSGLIPKHSKHRKESLRKHLHPSAAEVASQQWMALKDCDLFEGSWVRDDSYPLYKPGSCPHIDEPFNCFLNGRSDNFYEKFRWQPKNCNIPRLFSDSRYRYI